MQEMSVWSLGWKDSLEKEMATHSTIFLPGKFHETEQPGRLQSMGLKRTGLNLVTKQQQQQQWDSESTRAWWNGRKNFSPSWCHTLPTRYWSPLTELLVITSGSHGPCIKGFHNNCLFLWPLDLYRSGNWVTEKLRNLPQSQLHPAQRWKERDCRWLIHGTFMRYTWKSHTSLWCSCAQLHLTLCNPMDCSPPGSSVHGIFQARILEWGCHFLCQRIFLIQEIKPRSPESPALAARFFFFFFFYHWATWEALHHSAHFPLARTQSHGPIKPQGMPGNGASGKEPTCQYRRYKRCRFYPWVRKIPWRRVWQYTPTFLPGESHGQRSLSMATVHGVAKNWTWLKQLSTQVHETKGEKAWVLEIQSCLYHRH